MFHMSVTLLLLLQFVLVGSPFVIAVYPISVVFMLLFVLHCLLVGRGGTVHGRSRMMELA